MNQPEPRNRTRQQQTTSHSTRGPTRACQPPKETPSAFRYRVRTTSFCSRGGHAAGGMGGAWTTARMRNGCARHITDGYPHALNRHDVGGRTAETDRPTGQDQPASQPRRQKKNGLKRETTTDRPTMRDQNLGPPWRRGLQRLKRDGVSASELAGLPGFPTSRPVRTSNHPSIRSTLTIFLVLHHGEEATHKLAHADPPSLPPENPPQAPTVLEQSHQPTHQREIASITEEEKKRGCGIARQQADRGGGAPLSLAATCPPLGVAAATFRNPFGGVLGLNNRVWMGCAFLQ